MKQTVRLVKSNTE